MSDVLKAPIETVEEGEFFAALTLKKKAELNSPRWREITRLAQIVRDAGDSSTAIAVALYEKGCRLPAPEDEPQGPAAA